MTTPTETATHEQRLADLAAAAAEYARRRADDPWASTDDTTAWRKIADRLDQEREPRPTAPDGDPTFDLVAKMIADNSQRRLTRVSAALTVLRRYERRIVEEAAVMGFVLGYREGVVDARHHGVTLLDGKGRFPHDRDILANVIQHCDTTGELYPYLADACDGKRRRITKARMWPGEESK